MNDAHISFKADCYDQFTFLQPLFLQDIKDDSKCGVYITGINSPELEQWMNCLVVAVDGYIADAVINGFTDNLGKSHNPDTRYLLGLSQLYYDSSAENFRMDRGLFLKRSIIPAQSYVIYTLRKPGSEYLFELKVDWMIFKNPTLVDFKDQYSYWGNICEAKPFTKVVKKGTTVSLHRRYPGILQPYAKAIKKRSVIKEKLLQKRDNYRPTCDNTTPISTGLGFAFFILDDRVEGNYGVLIIQTFEVTDFDLWFKIMRNGFLILMEKNIKRLLLDLTGNSGGVLCLAYSLLGVLSPSSTFPYPATKYSYGTRTIPSDSLLRISKCVDEAGFKASPFKLQCFSDLVTRADFPIGAEWESAGEVKPKVLNGFISGYTKFSPFLMDKCVLKQSYLLADVKPAFEVIIVATDGLCGSSSAIVAAYLQQNGSPSLIIAVKPYGLIANLYSFAGGQVLNSNNIKDIAKRSSCFDMIPKALERIQGTITYRGIFNVDDDRNPLEYYILPANYRFVYTDSYAGSFSERWKDYFPKGMHIWRYPEMYKWDSSATGKVIAYST